MRSLAFASLLVLASLGCGHSPQSSTPSAAHEFLTAPEVSIEVLTTQNHPPSAAAIDLITKRIQENCSGTSTITTHSLIDVRRAWTQTDLVLLERDHSPISPPATLRLLYVPGLYAPNPNAYAVTYTPKSIAVFLDALKTLDLEPCVLLHEIGHVLGLVRNPLRQDYAHPYFHDPDPKCVMFFQAFGNTDFCAACKKELAQARIGH